MKIVFFGTPEFAVASLDALVKEGAEIAAVVTMPDKPAGRGHHLLQSDVKKYAVKHDIPVLQPRNLKDPEFIEQLRSIGADLFIVIAFRMLPESVWAMPPKGTFNLHASLLPRYRGAAPINRAVMNGDTKTGVTTFFLKHEIDTGDIIDQQEIDILPEDNVGDVHDKLMELGAAMVVKTVDDIEAGKAESHPQPEDEYIPAPKIFKEDCRIDWNRKASDIHNHIRGLSPYPAAWTTIEDESGKSSDAKIFQSRLTGESADGATPGAVRIEKKRLLVATSDEWLEVVSLQPQGKKRMEAVAYLLGYKPSVFK